jgi:hypothetical protein
MCYFGLLKLIAMGKRLPADTGNLLPVVAWLLTEDEVRT